MQKFDVYNDGVVSFYSNVGTINSFGAQTNVTSADDMTFINKMAYSLMSKRQQDFDFADKRDFQLSLKIKTRYITGIDSGCKAVIGDTLYDVSYIDDDRKNLYVYLTEDRKLSDDDDS